MIEKEHAIIGLQPLKDSQTSIVVGGSAERCDVLLDDEAIPRLLSDCHAEWVISPLLFACIVHAQIILWHCIKDVR